LDKSIISQSGGVKVGKQLSLLRDTDGEKTKERVEEHFSEYRMYLLTAPDDLMPKITQTFSIQPPSKSNAFHSTTESVAIERAEYEMERDDFIERTHRAVNRLSSRERELITKSYMTLEDVYDYDVYNEMGVSETTYYRIREKAFYKLAFSLRIVVYKDEETPVN
jgi:ArpU family phage transcriptional regulator